MYDPEVEKGQRLQAEARRKQERKDRLAAMAPRERLSFRMREKKDVGQGILVLAGLVVADVGVGAALNHGHIFENYEKSQAEQTRQAPSHGHVNTAPGNIKLPAREHILHTLDQVHRR